MQQSAECRVKSTVDENPMPRCDAVGAARRAARLMHEIPTTHCDTVGAARRAARLMHGLSIPAPYGRTKTGAAVSPGHPAFAEGDHLPGQMLLNGNVVQRAANPPPMLRMDTRALAKPLQSAVDS